MKALLIIDMQNDFVLDGAPFEVKGASKIINNVKGVLDDFRSKDFPVFHVVRCHNANGSDVEITRRKKFSDTPYTVEGTKGANIIDNLKPIENENIIKKTKMSAFFDTDLDLKLRSLKIDEIVITGVQTPNCIRQTAVDAICYNYVTYLVEDATAAQTPKIHDSNIMDMKNIGIKVIKKDQMGEILK
jgi:nicotinamidase-related amidase